MAVGGSRCFFSSGFLKPSPEPCGGTAGSGGERRASTPLSCECVPVMEGAAEQRGNKCVLPPSTPPTPLHSDASSQQMEVGICTVLHEWKLTRQFFIYLFFFKFSSSLEGKRCSGVFICAKRALWGGRGGQRPRVSGRASERVSESQAAASLPFPSPTAVKRQHPPVQKIPMLAMGQNPRDHPSLTSPQAQAAAR